MKKDKPGVYVKTFGCQMNVRDSEFVTGLLLEKGFGKAPSIEKADVILFNSCSVRKNAEGKLFGNIADLKKLKKSKPALVVGLIGCTAQSYGSDSFKKAPVIDIVCGPGNETDLPGLINDVLKNRCAMVALDKVSQKRPELFPKYRESGPKALVSISEGCDNFCSYCIVPYVRGRERSREPKDIVREVRELASRGFKEVTLLGQNVNSYRIQGTGVRIQKNKPPAFVGLLEQLNSIDGIERIRFMTSHPKDASEDLFKAMRDLEKVCEHLHLPLQSGSDRILKLMNRGYTKAHYSELADLYRKYVPGGSITTDVIVGFPSETARDFEATLKLLKVVGFDSLYTFKYSPRSPAKASKLKDSVSKEAKEARLEKLMAIQTGISEGRNMLYNGKIAQVLVEGKGARALSGLTGRTRTNKVISFDGNEGLIGKLVNIKIESVTPYALKGRVI